MLSNVEAGKFCDLLKLGENMQAVSEHLDTVLWCEEVNKIFFVWNKYYFYAIHKGDGEIDLRKMDISYVSHKDLFRTYTLGEEIKLSHPCHHPYQTTHFVYFIQQFLYMAPLLLKSSEEAVTVPKGLKFSFANLKSVISNDMEITYVHPSYTRVNFKRGNEFISLPSDSLANRSDDEVCRMIFLGDPQSGFYDYNAKDPYAYHHKRLFSSMEKELKL